MKNDDREPTDDELKELEAQGDNFSLFTDEDLVWLANFEDEMGELWEMNEIPFSHLGIDPNDVIDGIFPDEQEVRRYAEGNLD